MKELEPSPSIPDVPPPLHSTFPTQNQPTCVSESHALESQQVTYSISWGKWVKLIYSEKTAVYTYEMWHVKHMSSSTGRFWVLPPVRGYKWHSNLLGQILAGRPLTEPSLSGCETALFAKWRAVRQLLSPSFSGYLPTFLGIFLRVWSLSSFSWRTSFLCFYVPNHLG